MIWIDWGGKHRTVCQLYHYTLTINALLQSFTASGRQRNGLIIKMLFHSGSPQMEYKPKSDTGPKRLSKAFKYGARMERLVSFFCYPLQSVWHFLEAKKHPQSSCLCLTFLSIVCYIHNL